VKPETVFKQSHAQYCFDCDKCDHDFVCSLDYVTRERWCPYCKNKRLCEKEECIQCELKSFASNEKAKFWSKTKNGSLTPRDVFKQGHSKYWFDCDTCNHDFEKELRSVGAGGIGWCPYCAGQKLCEKKCIHCFNKSFASHAKSIFWSKTENGDVKPRDVFNQSNTKYWFDCNECNHCFDSALNHIVAGTWCPYCKNKKLCENPNCEFCFNNSFASHEKSKFWSKKNGDVKPRDVFKNGDPKYWFDCLTCKNSFDSTLSNILAEKWCPYCKNKTEQKLYDALKAIYPSIIHQFKQEWCKKRNYLPFDLCIPELKIIIELDGPQHFMQVSNWSSPEETHENDLFKERCANDNNYSMIRIIQEDVLNDTYDWRTKIVSSIEEIRNSGNIENHYLCENNEYDEFIVTGN
jgi:very-short-patch-repair endonuclease